MLPAKEREKNIVTNNLAYIDYIRIFAAVMVILLHSISSFFGNSDNFQTKFWWFCNFVNEICRTGVPLFFMISGYLMLTKSKITDLKSFYKKRIFKILIPFLIWDIIYYCYFRHINNQKILDFAFFEALMLNGSSYHLWYIYSIMLLYLFIPFIKMITDKASLKTQLFFLCLVIFQTTLKPFFNITTGLYLYLAEDGIIGYLGYMILGNILGKSEIKKNTRVLIYVLGIMGGAIGIFGNYFYSLKNGYNLIFNGGYQINHYLFAAALFVFFRYDLPKMGDTINKLTSKLAASTLTVYFVHVLILEILDDKFMHLSPAISNLSVFLITVFTSFSFAYILENIIIRHFHKIKIIN